jgi:rhodanese-related sulfurtransferase
MIESVRPSELGAWLAACAERRPVVLDVREPWEVQTASLGALPGAELVCIPMGQVVQQLAMLDPERPTACLCHHGARSLRVAHFLLQQGFAQVANIDGGIHAWSLECDQSVPVY